MHRQFIACHAHPTTSAGAFNLLKFALTPKKKEEAGVSRLLSAGPYVAELRTCVSQMSRYDSSDIITTIIIVA